MRDYEVVLQESHLIDSDALASECRRFCVLYGLGMHEISWALSVCFLD